MSRRRTIGENPLDAVIPTMPTRSPEPAPPRTPATLPPPTSLQATGPDLGEGQPVAREFERVLKRERVTLHISAELVDRIRNAVYWTPGLTMAELAESALAEALTAIETERGSPFAPRGSELKRGRPVKL